MKKDYSSPTAKIVALCIRHPLLNIEIGSLAVRN